MISLRSLTLFTAFALLQNHAAAQVVVGTKTYSDNENFGTKCPGILSMNNNNNNNNDNKGFCCVGGNVSTCKGWPLCASTAEITPVTCATKIPVTASDYSSLIESASSKYLDSAGKLKPSATADSTMASATGDKTSADESTGTDSSAGEAKKTGDDDNAAVGIRVSLLGGVVGGVLALGLAL